MIIDALLAMNEEDLPYLMLKDKKGQTPLDIAIIGDKNKNTKTNVKSVESLLKLIIYHKSAAREYNEHIDKHLISLIENKLNLKDLFQSEILYYHKKLEPKSSQD